MKGLLYFGIGLILFAVGPLSAQQSRDWDTLWINKPPASPGHPNWFMSTRDRTYTGLAYDRFRDVLYIVNPDITQVQNYWVPTPRIHIWDAATGVTNTGLGRALNGMGGQLPVPLDTVDGGYIHRRFSLYKIDVDDEGRIYACNLVAPIFEAPPNMCMGQDTTQGPWQVYRWDAPSATPKRVYASLRARKSHLLPPTYDSIGTTKYNSEMAWSRWGDAFEVVGKRGWERDSAGQPVQVDSTRILVSGGPFCMQNFTNREVNVFVADRRPARAFDFRLGVRVRSSLEGIASHGIATTGPLAFSEIWMDNAIRVTTLNNQNQDTGSIPQDFTMSTNLALSEDSASGTGPSGALAFMQFPHTNLRLLVCTDARPTDPYDAAATNYNTTARLMDVTNPVQATRFLESTPRVGYNTMNVNAGVDGLFNYVTDIDYKLEFDENSSRVFITLFVLMSNNGIAAFRTRNAIVIPVELGAFTAALRDDAVQLEWEVLAETDNHGFEVQRSFDAGRSWEILAFVPGRGTTGTPTRYTYADPLTSAHRALGKARYRLRQIDTDGTSTLSHAVEVAIASVSATFTIDGNYPNPFTDRTSIAFTLREAAQTTLAVYSSLGERVATLVSGWRDAGPSRVTWDASSCAAGTYIVRMTNGSNVAERCLTIVR